MQITKIKSGSATFIPFCFILIVFLISCSSLKETNSKDSSNSLSIDTTSYINPADYGYNPLVGKWIIDNKIPQSSFQPVSIQGGLRRAQRMIEYPKIAREMKISGKVMLTLYVDSTGTLKGINVRKSPHPLLTKASKDAAKKFYFNAATLNGKPVNSFIFVPMTYQTRSFKPLFP